MTFDPRTLPNGAFWPNLALFSSFVLMIVAQLADYYITMKALDKGLSEANPVVKFLSKKLGLAGASFAGILATMAIGFVFLGVGGIAQASVYAGVVGVAESVRSFLNYRLIKKVK